MSKSNYDMLTDGELKNVLNTVKKDISSKKNAGKKNIYFAAPWFTDKAKHMYNFCKDMFEHAKNQTDYCIFFPMYFTGCTPEETFQEDVKNVLTCDTLIALVDDKDVGTAWEIGMAYASGKPIYLVGLDESTFEKRTNLMLAFSGNCFTIDKFYKFLTCGLGHDDFVNISKKWEDLE